MTHFAVVSPPLSSHVAALRALAGELLDRGHRVSWLGPADLRPSIADPRIGFLPVPFEADGAAREATGAASFERRAANPDGLFGLMRLIGGMARMTTRLCEAGRPALVAAGVEALIADQMEAAGGLLAEALGLPCASVACALPIDREPALPLPVMPWGPATRERSLHRNAISARVHDRLMSAHGRAIEACCRAWGLPLRQRLDQCLSPTLEISQTPAAFDFPRAALPPHFHAVGPLRPATAGSRESPATPGIRLRDGRVIEPSAERRFVFVSLGTLQGGRFGLLRRIVRAGRRLGVQMLVAHCGGLDARRAAALESAGATWVTDFADQPAALARADAVVTHAGLNTVLDAFRAGTPALALPIAFDQAGVAARLVHAGAGLRLAHRYAGAGRIAAALARLLDEPDFACRSAALGAATRAAGGVVRAADLIEATLVRAPAPG